MQYFSNPTPQQNQYQPKEIGANPIEIIGMGRCVWSYVGHMEGLLQAVVQLRT